jgi:DNA-directed RNA polymerase specialized sigma24 family protein
MENGTRTDRQSLYAEVTSRVIAELEAGRLPWVQPWDGAACGCTMPHNAGTGRRYSGINVLILWAAVMGAGYGSQRWLTYRQAQAVGANVRRGERGTVVCYADRFTPKGEQSRAQDEDRDARQVAFLKRFTVFNVDQCEGLPDAMTAAPDRPAEVDILPQVQSLIEASGADFRVSARGGVMDGNRTEAETIARLELGLRRMAKRRREIFLAAQRDGVAYEEIAKRTGISVAEVERHVAGALVGLHEALDDRAPRSRWRELLRWIVAMIDR